MSLFFFVFFLEILKCQVLLQGISGATNIVIYHTVTTEKIKEKKFLNSVSRFALKWVKETSFYEKKKNYKNMNFRTKGKFILQVKKEFFGLRNIRAFFEPKN